MQVDYVELPQVFVDKDLPSYDLDGVGIAGFDDGSHLLQLMLGMGYAPFCVVFKDREPGVWALMQAPSIMLSRDEYEIMSSSVTFSVAPFTFQVQADAPTLQLLKPRAKENIRIITIQFWAKQDPFRWQAKVMLADRSELLCGPTGWSLNGKPVEFRIDLEVPYMKPRTDHLNPDSAVQFLDGVNPEFPYVVARGQYSPDPAKSERCFLYYRAADHLVAVRESWLTPAEIKRVAKHAHIEMGECDAMYAPAPRLVWHGNTDRFSVYRNNKLLFRFSAEGLRIFRFPISQLVFAQQDIKGIQVYLNRGWVECGLKLVLAERELTLVRNFEWAAAADPTYDGFCLLADTAWAVALGKSLSKVIGCAYIADKGLKDDIRVGGQISDVVSPKDLQ